MKIKLDKWDNSPALRIPKSFANKAKLKEGSVIDLSIFYESRSDKNVRPTFIEK